LYQRLVSAGLSDPNDFRFVGSQSGTDGTPENSDFDQTHEGHDGWTSQDGVTYIGGIAAQTPDIVLFDLGANDVQNAAGSADLSQTEANLEQIIDGFRSANSDVIILLAVPTPWIPINGDPAQNRQEKKQMSQLQGVISRVAAAEQATGARIIKVNLFGGYSARHDTVDGDHPNVSGEKKIANKFYAGLKKAYKQYYGITLK
jgi:mannan endo-1,4-beta-mannosidase